MTIMGSSRSPIIVEDLFLAAGIYTLTQEFPHLCLRSPGRVVFQFGATPETLAALSGFPGRATGVLCDFATNFRLLRRQMYTLLNYGGEGKSYHRYEEDLFAAHEAKK